MSGHYQTGEPMPKEMVQALVKNRHFLSGMAMLRQVKRGCLPSVCILSNPVSSSFISPRLTWPYTPPSHLQRPQLTKLCLISMPPSPRKPHWSPAYLKIASSVALPISLVVVMLLVTTRKAHIHLDMHWMTDAPFTHRYKYSETFSADAYGAFEEAEVKGGNDALVEVGQRYRDTILALGGGTPPRQVWAEFRGRPTVDVSALLRHSGLQ